MYDEILVTPTGRVIAGTKRFACTLGRAGIVADKREGDGGTPRGRFVLRQLLYRADRIAPPATALPIAAISADDGWCDDPAHPAYNRPVKRPFAASHEEMWRADGLYDVVIVVGHNDDPPVPGLGSAIFIHVAHPEGEPTAGCVALDLPDLLTLCQGCGPGTWLTVL